MQALVPFTEQDAVESEERIFALEEAILGQRLDRPDNWESVATILAEAQLQEWQRYDLILASLR